MFLHRVKSTYGRLIPKPKTADSAVEDITDEAIPIQDQIEALMTKIALKKRYNNVLKDELEESRLGADSILQDLYHETMELRHQLIDAMNAEKSAVQKALRSHRDFQLAMTDKTPEHAIPWLDDKLFDLSKHLNIYLHRFVQRHGALQEAESMVFQLEKWPRPGSLPWEVDAIANFHKLENMIENMKVNLETANIMSANYDKIKHILREEKGKYAPTLKNLDYQVLALKQEKAQLQKMLDDADYFRVDAERLQIETEHEASDNRKKRRRQMNKMRKAVDRVLAENQVAPEQQIEFQRRAYFQNTGEASMFQIEFLEKIRLKRFEVEKYEDRARRLVDIMRVQDLTFIPSRFHSVMALGKTLNIETEAKEELRDLLLRHRDQLYLISCFFNYTGCQQEIEYKSALKTYEGAFQELSTAKQEFASKLNEYGDIIVHLRLVSIAVLNLLDEGKCRHRMKSSLQDTIKSMLSRVRRLVGDVNSLEVLFGDRPALRNYAQFARRTSVASRLARIGSAEQSEESDEEEFIDLKIPTREDIKAKSLRVIHQGMLQKGLMH